MHLTHLKINTLPGIEPEFALEPPSLGINVVTGPNAIGKSSLARALAHLLAGVRKDDPPALSLEAEFATTAQVRWRVRRNGGQVLWERNGEAASPPPLPAADQFGLYRLAMEQLLASDHQDKDLAEELRRQLRGGFDPDQPRIDIGARFAAREEKNLLDAQRERHGVERKYEDLRNQEIALPAVEAHIEDARKAAAHRQRLECALALHKAVGDRQAKAAALNALPPDMSRLQGREAQRLDELDKRAENLGNLLREHNQALTVDKEALARTGLDQSRPTAADLKAAEARLQQIGQWEAERKGVQEASLKAHEACQDALSQLKGPGSTPKLDADSLKSAEAIAGPLAEAEERRRLLGQQLKLSGEAPEHTEIDRLRQGMSALLAWLAVQTDAEDNGKGAKAHRVLWPGWITVVAVLIAASMAFSAGAWLAAAVTNLASAAFIVDVLLAVAVTSLVALALAWGLAAIRQAPRRSPAEDARSRYRETGLAPPEWRETEVRNRLQVVEAQLYQLDLQQARAQGSDKIAAEIQEQEAEIAKLTSRKRALAAEIGFDPSLPTAYFDRFVHLSRNWDQARLEHRQQEAGLRQIDENIGRLATLVVDFMGSWTDDCAAAFKAPDGTQDIHLLRASFDQLQGRVAEADQIQSRIRGNQAEIEAEQRQLADVQNDIRVLFEDAGLAVGERAELARRIEQIGPWREARDACNRALAEERRLRGLLSDSPELLTIVDAGDITELGHQGDAAARKADALDGLQQQRTEIRTRLEDAGKNGTLEAAMAKESRALASLEDKRDQALLSEATNLLLDEVGQTFQAEHEPKVLRRARALFSQVTGYAFDLKLGKDGDFTARDLKLGAVRTLDQLSSGTRMQLLLALRLAWVEAQEQDCEPLPLFLDEALTTSDEGRFAVMATSLERLSEAQGRQIFYLTARRHERALWQQATGRQPAMVDLAAVRFGAARATEDFIVESPPALPAPANLDPEEYAARIGVADLDPWLAPDSIHLFHLLRDQLTLMHHLMDIWRIDSLGLLEALLGSSAAQGAVADTGLRQRLKKRCHAARTWVEAWRQGRGQPVNRGALEQSGAISRRFIDRAVDLAAQQGGDGAALVDALRSGALPRFHNIKIDQLEQWLVDQGHLDRQQPLSGDDRLRSTLQQAEPETGNEAAELRQLVTWLESALKTAAT